MFTDNAKKDIKPIQDGNNQIPSNACVRVMSNDSEGKLYAIIGFVRISRVIETVRLNAKIWIQDRMRKISGFRKENIYTYRAIIDLIEKSDSNTTHNDFPLTEF